ncbi:MAG: hypothetical protein V1725_01315 [archaeon]
MTDEKNMPAEKGEIRQGLQSIVEGFVNVARGVRRKVKKTANDIEHQLETREGVIGDIADVVDNGVKTVRDIHASVQEKGGYLQTGRGYLNDALAAIRESYQSAIDSLTTNGRYDADKVKQVLQDKGEAAKKYGQEGVSLLSRLGTMTKNVAETKFRKYWPTAEELETKYAGIGDGKRVLFKPHLETVLKFYKYAEERLPTSASARSDVLADLKKSAAQNGMELDQQYNFKNDVDGSKRKLVETYLLGFRA